MTILFLCLYLIYLCFTLFYSKVEMHVIIFQTAETKAAKQNND